MRSRKGINGTVDQGLAQIGELLKPVCLGRLPENPLVSVLTANYNYASFIGEAIESIVAQTYAKLEMIVCDDGSTDKSCDVVEHYARRDPRLRLVTQENGGQASAWNTAYRECKGEIICFLDADDRFLPEKLRAVVQAFLSHPDSGFLGHRMNRIDIVGRRDGVVPATADPPSGWYGPIVVRSGTSPPAMAFGSGLCLRREISDLILPIPEELRVCADEAVTTLGPLMTPLIGIPVPLADYRYHGENVWNSPHITAESRDRLQDIRRRMWTISQEYLEKVDPTLIEMYPPFEKCQGTLLNAYIQARMQAWRSALCAYRDLLRAETFVTMRPAWRWFWRFSIALPPPVFRFAIGGSGLRQWAWKAREARRRLLRN